MLVGLLAVTAAFAPPARSRPCRMMAEEAFSMESLNSRISALKEKPEPEAVPPPPPRPGFRGCLCEYPREFLGDQASRSALETFMETFPPGLDTAL